MIFNDITARDIQRREMRSGVFSFCKAIDTFCPLGPWIVTPDEIPDPHDLRMELRVNGEVRQESHSGSMAVTIPEILAHYSALGLLRGRRRLDRDGQRRRGLQRGRGLALPEARRRHGGRDRADRRAAESGRLVAGGARGAATAARALVSPSAVEIRVLTGAAARSRVDGLADVLLDCVQGGASVGFMSSLTAAEASEYFVTVATKSTPGGVFSSPRSRRCARGDRPGAARDAAERPAPGRDREAPRASLGRGRAWAPRSWRIRAEALRGKRSSSSTL